MMDSQGEPFGFGKLATASQEEERASPPFYQRTSGRSALLSASVRWRPTRPVAQAAFRFRGADRGQRLQQLLVARHRADRQMGLDSRQDGEACLIRRRTDPAIDAAIEARC